MSKFTARANKIASISRVGTQEDEKSKLRHQIAAEEANDIQRDH